MVRKAEDIKITFNMDKFTWGDWEAIRTGGYVGLLKVCERIGEIEGEPQKNVGKILRELGFKEIQVIDQMFGDAMQDLANPVDETGKN
jgi:hypothetical protein